MTSRTRAGLRGADASARVQVLRVDLSDRESVRKCVTQFNNKRCNLDILVNAAGALFIPYHVNEDGLEGSFASNHVGHYHLTCLLMPRLNDAGGRVVNVASLAHEIGAVYAPFAPETASECGGYGPLRQCECRAARACAAGQGSRYCSYCRCVSAARGGGVTWHSPRSQTAT